VLLLATEALKRVSRATSACRARTLSLRVSICWTSAARLSSLAGASRSVCTATTAAITPSAATARKLDQWGRVARGRSSPASARFWATWA
jgi:hypothetical protein